ncbi:MAG: tetratricopeptide repeat protein [Saprospiraceae bacterium]
MRIILSTLLLCISITSRAQVVDSVAIAEADSLIQVAYDQSVRQSFDSALVAIRQAQNVAIDRIGNPSTSLGDAFFIHGRIYYAQREFQQAEDWYHKAKVILQVTPGKSSALYAECLNSLAILKQTTGHYPEARTLYDEVIQLRRALQQGGLAYASSVNNQAIVCQQLGDLESAKRYYLEARDSFAQILGVEHPNYASTANNLAGLYYLQGNYELAEPLFLEAIAIRRKVFGDQDAELAESLNNLANLYAREEKVELARQRFEESQHIRLQLFGPDNPIVAGGMIDRGQFYAQMGDYAAAEKILKEAREILESRQAANNPAMYFNCLMQLAALYSQTGRFDLAEPLFLENRQTAMENLGKEDPYAILSVSKLGMFYQSLGDMEKAEGLYQEHLGLLEQTVGKDHEEYGKSLSTLANLYTEQGRDSLARPLFMQSLSILEKTIGKAHSNYATVINSLATLEFNRDSFQLAEPLFQQALASYAASLGDQHPFYARCLGNLGNLYVSTGQLDQAGPYCELSRKILESQYGKEHPDYVFSLQSLANLYERQGRHAEADTLLHEVFIANEARVNLAASFLSEQEMANYIRLFEKDGNDLYGYLHSRTINRKDHTWLNQLAYDHTLYYKGFLLLAANRLNKLGTSTPKAAAVFERLKEYRQRLAYEYAKPKDRRREVDMLETQANQAEKELTQLVAGYGDALRQVRSEDVRASLKQDEISIEFIHYRENGQGRPDSVLYGALVLWPDSLYPTFVPLCKEDDVDKLVRSATVRGADYVDKLYSVSHRGFVVSAAPLKTLYELIWEPLEQLDLSGVNTIYFSPTGLLHRINLGAIPIGPDSVVTNRYHLVMVNSTRQIPGGVVDTMPSVQQKNALVLGAIEFDRPDQPGGSSGASGELSPVEAASVAVDAAERGGTGSWGYLKATEKEMATIEDILKDAGYAIQAVSGLDASEEFIKQVAKGDARSPGLMHFATHGFFFPDPATQSASTASTQSVFILSEQPMMRSGLILAGANYAWLNGHPIREGEEDGILTAYEISQMDLAQTGLVVLSACETGLGDIKGNEGVYGLQRAFKIAGVDYLIMTLWKVDDKATALFMIEFYKHYLQDGMSIPDAFRLTQQEFIANPLSSPYLWAGFVLLE